MVKDDPLALEHGSLDSGSSSSSSSLSYEATSDIPEQSSSLHSLVFSFTMILVSEIGDKTFLVAALMAMRHPRLVVFTAAFSALIGMTVLSAVLGHAVPTLIPKTFTKFMAAILFLIFGAKMLKEGREMSPDEGVGEEMREVEMELEEKEHQQLRMNRRRSSVTPHSLEAGRAGRPKTRGSGNRLPSPPESVSSSSSRGSSPQPRQRLNDLVSGLNNLCSLLLSPAWVQTFVMTFLGEWGDRSQIATIAMAAGQDYWWVTIGASAGHGICTAAAVIGGRAIAGRVSMRVGMYQYFPPSLFKDNANNDTYSDSRWCRCIPHFWRHLFHRSHFLERCISAVVCVYGFSFRVFGGWFACKSRLHLCDISLF
jgi:putative Ca2+/H+ antiporter (TMEM165/GDT1 family)